MEERFLTIGNVSTIINTVSLMIAGFIFGVLANFGLKLPFDMTGLSAIIGLIIATIFSYVNAKYHNTFFNTEDDSLKIDVSNLTPNQITAIQGFIDNAEKLNKEL